MKDSAPTAGSPLPCPPESHAPEQQSLLRRVVQLGGVVGLRRGGRFPEQLAHLLQLPQGRQPRQPAFPEERYPSSVPHLLLSVEQQDQTLSELRCPVDDPSDPSGIAADTLALAYHRSTIMTPLFAHRKRPTVPDGRTSPPPSLQVEEPVTRLSCQEPFHDF